MPLIQVSDEAHKKLDEKCKSNGKRRRYFGEIIDELLGIGNEIIRIESGGLKRV